MRAPASTCDGKRVRADQTMIVPDPISVKR